MDQKKMMKEINYWLDKKVVKYPTEPYKILDSNYNYYYTPYEIKKYSKNGQIIVDSETRRCDANNLFCELVNYCAKNKLYDSNGLTLINTKNKNSFYNFIRENSI